MEYVGGSFFDSLREVEASVQEANAEPPVMVIDCSGGITIPPRRAKFGDESQ